jgi:hypothetical protein
LSDQPNNSAAIVLVASAFPEIFGIPVVEILDVSQNITAMLQHIDGERPFSLRSL